MDRTCHFHSSSSDDNNSTPRRTMVPSTGVSATERRIVRTLAVVVACHVICWAPIEVADTAYKFGAAAVLDLYVGLTFIGYVNISA